MIRQILTSKILQRNVIFLILLSATLSLAPNGLAQGYFYIINTFFAQQTLTDQSSYVAQEAVWSILGRPVNYYYFAYENARCLFTSVSNTSSLAGVEFGYYVTATSMSTVIATGTMRNGL